MIQAHELTHGMRVVAADKRELGRIDTVDTNEFKLAKNSTADGHHHDVPLSWVDRVEGDTVHLNRSATEDATMGALGTARGVEEGRKSILPWLLGALAAIILLALLLRGCDRDDPASNATVETGAVEVPGPMAPAAGTGVLATDVQAYLGGSDAVPRTFTFERLNFDTSSSAIREQDRTDLDQLAQVLAARPTTRVRVVGYADARGGEQANAQLGLERARSVAAALTAKGVAADRIETASGGEATPTDTNATAGGQFENRRTELVVLSR